MKLAPRRSARGIATRVAPVLVVGMHRSGTTAVADVLRALGVFMGARLDQNSEPAYVQRLNDWMLRCAGASWDNPGPVRYLLGNPPFCDAAAEHVGHAMASRRATGYLGAARALRASSPARLRGPWGWKDPRTTLTLPVWLRLFPDARVVHVVRHGVDVAASLRARMRRTAEARSRRTGALYRLALQRHGIADSLRCADVGEGIRLWDEYLTAAATGLQHADNVLELRYEAVLDDPRAAVDAIARLVGVPSTPRAAHVVRSGRVLAYRADDGLRRAAEDHRATLERHGYAP